MSVTFQCGECGHQYTVPDEFAGKWVRCKHCESTLEVPGPVAEPPVAELLPEEPIRPAPAAPAPAAPTPAPAASQPALQPLRPAPQPTLQPLRPAPIRPTGRPRVSADTGVDKKVVVIAVGAVGAVLGIVVLMMVVMFGGSPANDVDSAQGPSRRTASESSSENASLDFTREPQVEFGPAQVRSSSVPGVVWQEVRLSGNANEPGTQGKLWVYLPSGNHAPGSLGCVLIGPAGSRMVHGMALAAGDQAEHYPYAQQGFAVVAFEIDGPLPDENPSDDRFRDAYLKFTDAAAGVVNARVALQYATTKLPEIDTDRIFVAGHSSAGTVALLSAQHVDGLAGCVAYAPCSDLEDFLSEFIGEIDGNLPNVRQYMIDGSPLSHLSRLRCPVLICHAVDDRVVRLSESNTFSARGKQAGGDITLDVVPRGGHYDAMIDEGIGKAIAWMNRTSPPASSPVAAATPTPSVEQRLPSRPTGFRPPGFRPPDVPMPPRISSTGSVRAHVHLKIISYPSGNADILAKDALRPVIWADPRSIKVDRAADEIVIGVRISAVNTNDAKLRLERVGFVIGGASYKPVRN